MIAWHGCFEMARCWPASSWPSRARNVGEACSGGTASTGRCCCVPPARCTRWACGSPSTWRSATPTCASSGSCGCRATACRGSVWRSRAVIEAEAGVVRPLAPAAGRRARGQGVRNGDRRDGVLVLVGTPIGNLGDLAPRAVEALRSADAICCEDTRRTGRLLQHAGRRAAAAWSWSTSTPRPGRFPACWPAWRRGERVAVVSDAGMPGISDPGERLVRAAVAAGHPVEVVPGPSAALAALVASGLPAGRFVFEGFLPRKGSGRAERLAAVAAEPAHGRAVRGPPPAGPHGRRPGRRVRRRPPGGGGPRAHQAARGGVAGLAGRRAGVGGRAAAPGRDRAGARGRARPRAARRRALVDALQDELAAGATARDAARAVAARLDVPRRRAYDLATRLAATRT